MLSITLVLGILASCQGADPAFDVGTGTSNQPISGNECPESQSIDEDLTYLDHPRIHFSGLYQADVATINNYYDNFNTSSFSLLNQLVKKSMYASFNPLGSNGFSFQNCKITMVCRVDRSCTTDDELVGMPLESTAGHASGKIVDTDVELGQAMIYGMAIGLDIHKSKPFIGLLRPSGEQDPWRNVWNGDNIDPNWQTGYQSVLENLKWNDQSHLLVNDSVLHQLKNSVEVLSIKFNLDHYHQENFSDPLFLYGRVTGTIGPGSLNRPVHYLRQRLLQFVQNPVATGLVDTNKKRFTNTAAFKVQTASQHVTFDFGNAVCRSTYGGGWNFPMMGNELVIVTRDGKHVIETIDLTSDNWYTINAGIFQVRLTSQLVSVINSSPVDVYNERDELLMQEVEVYSRPMDGFVKKLDPNDTWDVTFFVNKLGKSLPNHVSTLQVLLASSHTANDKKEQAMKAFQITNALPDPNQKYTYSFTSNCSGMFTVQFKASNPGKLREYVDGEVYKVSYVSDIDNQGYTYLYARVFDEFPVPDEPTWFGENGVEKILLQYDNLFPVMRKFLVLSDYCSVTKPSNIHFVNLSMSLSISQPGHMPVTRDLSKGKRETILKWLGSPKRGNVKLMDFENLKQNLQTAIEVEHSTIPLYLYSLFSIKPGSNVQAYNLIRSVLMEEMVHMALACNILNAVGGSPNLTHDKFIPIYPGPMAGGLHPELTLRLGPLSKDILKNVFMVLEEPRRDPIEHDPEIHNKTIGMFYHKIQLSLAKLVDEMGEANVFVGDPSLQVDGTCFPPETASTVFKVTDLESANKAIDLIVREGEGSSQLNPNDGEGELAHFYKFAEIYHGRQLVRNNETGNWSYTGDLIPLDPEGIYPLISNPRLEDYPEGSRARFLAADFSRCYLNLLGQLQLAFNGQPEFVGETFGAMNFLSIKASHVTVLPLNELATKHAGPTFLNPLLMP